VVRDISERKHVDAELRIAAIAFESQDGIVVTNADSVILRVNRAFTRITGYTADEAVGHTPSILKSGLHDKAFYAEMWASIRLAGAWHGEIWNRRKNGEIYPERLTITAVKGNAGETTNYVATLRDITEQKRVEEALQESEALLQATMKILPVGLWIMNAEGKIVFGNTVGQQIWAGARYVGVEQFGEYKGWWLDSGKRIEPHEWSAARAIEKGEISIEEEIEIECFDGTHKIILNSSLPLRRSDGSISGAIIVNQDITERKQAEGQIRHLAFYDTLTQLPNRRLLNDRIGQVMAASKRSGNYGALMFLDLDNFKPLNDTHGHDVGDLLLVEVAHRIASCVREVDTVARFGGDEFVVMLSELDADKDESTEQVGAVAEKIRATLAEPYFLTFKQEGGAEITVVHHCTSSIGVALFINHEAGPEDVLKWADIAMYQAKESGRNRVHFYGA
jgi:diguanylate cyclase (GGDEF)-like protein/PAS domain S-box-containing protein